MTTDPAATMASGPIVTPGRVIGLIADENVVADIDLAIGFELNAIGLVQHGDRAVVTDHGAVRTARYFPAPDIGRIREIRGRQDMAVFPHRMKNAAPLQVLAYSMLSGRQTRR